MPKKIKVLTEDEKEDILDYAGTVAEALKECEGWRKVFDERYEGTSRLPDKFETRLNCLDLGVVDEGFELEIGALKPPGRAFWNRRRREVLFQVKMKEGDGPAEAWQKGMDGLTLALYGAEMRDVHERLTFPDRFWIGIPETDNDDLTATVESLTRFSAYTASSVGTSGKRGGLDLEPYRVRKGRKIRRPQRPLRSRSLQSQIDSLSFAPESSVSATANSIAPESLHEVSTGETV